MWYNCEGVDTPSLFYGTKPPRDGKFIAFVPAVKPAEYEV